MSNEEGTAWGHPNGPITDEEATALEQLGCTRVDEDMDPGQEDGGTWTIWRSADGGFLAPTKRGGYLRWLLGLGIRPETQPHEEKVRISCNIGFSEAEQQWFGWSHRAAAGFGIGSEVKPGDCAYVPATPQELYDKVTHTDEDGYQWMKPEDVELLPDGVRLRFRMMKHTKESPDGELSGFVNAGYDYVEKKCGRGAWTAKTLEDAKQMAIDFAESVG